MTRARLSSGFCATLPHRAVPILALYFSMNRSSAFVCLIAAMMPARSSLAADAPAPSSAVRLVPGGSFVVHAFEAKDKPTPKGASANYCDRATPTLARFEVHRTTLLPGRMPHAAHRHEREEMMIVLRGELEAALEGKKTPSSEGSVFFMASNDMHGVTNIGEKPATYLVLNFHLPPAEQGAPAAVAPTEGLLPSTVWDWDKLPVKSSATTDRRNFVDGPTRARCSASRCTRRRCARARRRTAASIRKSSFS